MRLQLLTTVALSLCSSVIAFTPHRTFAAPSPTIVLNAGGFEWEDPVNAFDQGVDNPYKNADLMTPTDGGMKIDPARLLSPRLNGANVYFIGMMGSGKTSVGEAVARSKLRPEFWSFTLETRAHLCFPRNGKLHISRYRRNY
jgi:shikimate kinase